MRNFLPSFSLVVAFFWFLNIAKGADEKFPRLQIGNNFYTNVVVTSKTATDVFILHKGGVANFKLKNLSPDLQKQLGFDSEKAAAQEKKQAVAISEYNMARASVNSVANTNLPKEIWAKSFLNQKAPTLIVEKWLTPAPETEGKFVLIFFWLSASAPCQKVVPLLNQLHQKFGKRLVVMGLSDEPEEVVLGFTEPPVDFFSAIDPTARTRQSLEVSGLPHVILVDPLGIIRWEGFPLLAGHMLTEQVIQDALTKFTTP